MSPTVYYVIHVVSLLLLTGYTFYAFAAPAETRKKVLMITGIASLLMLISGFGLISKLYANNFTGWMIVKMVCWLGISGLAGVAYRRREKVKLFATLAVAFAFVAVLMVYTKPF
jgi:hypothetical protein